MKLSHGFGALGLAVCLVLLSGCLATTPRTRAGARIGGIVGAIGGAVIDDDNPWRGGVLGAAAGALIGTVIGDIVDQAAIEAAREDAPVAFQRVTPEGRVERVEAKPVGVGVDGTTKIISVKHLRDGVVIKEEVRKVPN